MKTPYQGHESYTAWNVCLWLGNDEGLYRACQEAVRTCKTLRAATNRMLGLLPAKTPDGCRYSYRTVYLTLADLKEAEG
jgi:hypothetical protein